MDDDDAIAIVGIGGKFPGANNCDEFWKVLVNGENHVVEIPPNRWNVDEFYDADYTVPGKTYVRRAGFILNFDEWDNKLFGISEVESARMDPQQRYVLDCVQMALEDGGIRRKDISGTNTGVYIGVMNDDYKGSSSDDLNVMNNYTLTGTAPSIVAARVSYVFNLLGPAMSIDTACSSSLVAIHVASQALKSGDCSMAICGGVNNILYPHIFIPLTKARMVSPTGQSQAFSDTADGYARGEGCGVVVLKTLGQAKRDGNKIWAVIATGCNQDGRTMTPMTAPSGSQQTALLQKVYKEFNVPPQCVQYIEAHGTGTPVGDPIEANSLGNYFSQYNDSDDADFSPVKIGSVKTNIGHLESAAGVAGLIKVLLMMKHGKFVPTLHFKNSNPQIDFPSHKMEVATEVTDWNQKGSFGRVSCVNSFGFGGTNSHAILKQYIEDKQEKLETSDQTGPKLVVLSAQDSVALKNSLEHLLKTLQTENSGYSIDRIAYTSAFRRDHYAYRLAFVTENIQDLCKQGGEQMKTVLSVRPPGIAAPHVVFVFCGVGTTWTGMCCDLMEQNEVVDAAIRDVDSILTPMTKWSIYEKLKERADMSDPLLGHLAIFTCQIGIAALWKHWGVCPNAIVGQSVGEVAASYIAGALSLENAVKVIYHRSAILAKQTGGGMCVIGNSSTRMVEDLCEKYKGRANIAVNNSSKSCTLSGDKDALEDLKRDITEESTEKENQVLIKDLNVQCAYHSHHVKDAGTSLQNALQGLSGSTPSVNLFSTVTGEEGGLGDFTTSSYWNDNVCKPVLFQKAVQNASDIHTYNIFIDIGPKPVLKAHIYDNFQPEDAICIPSMKQNSDISMMMSSLGDAYKCGLNPSFENITNPDQEMTDLPKYIPNRVKNLFEADSTKLRNQGLSTKTMAHKFIQRASDEKVQFKISISPSTTPYVYEHVVSNTILVPGAFYAEIGLEVGKQILCKATHEVEVSVEFCHPLGLSAGKPCQLEVKMDDIQEKMCSFQIQRGSEVIAKCTAKELKEDVGPTSVDLLRVRDRCGVPHSADLTYQTLKNLGFSYGEDLQILKSGMKSKTECLVNMQLSDLLLEDIGSTNIHPAVLDGLLQTPGVLQSGGSSGRTLLPGGIGQLILKRPVEKDMLAYMTLLSSLPHEIRYNGLLLKKDGTVIADIRDFVIRSFKESNDNNESLAHHIVWNEMHLPDVPKNHTAKNLLLLAPDKETLSSYKEYISDDEIKFSFRRCEEFDIAEELTDKTAPDCIIYGHGQINAEDIPDGEYLLQNVVANCCFLISLLQHMSKFSLTIPVYVVTQNTQHISIQSDDYESNLMASELWGMVRTILRENEFKLYLIDIHPNLKECIGILMNIIKGHYNTLPTPELLICDGKIHHNELKIQPNDERLSQHRISMRGQDCPLELKSCMPDVLKDLFYSLQNNNTHDRPDDFISIQTEKACLHDQRLYPVTEEGAFGSASLWPMDSTNGYGILSFEILGKKLKSKQDHQKKHENSFVACYPMKVQSVVQVPKSCVCNVKDIPGYVPGLLKTSAILWDIMKHLPDRKVYCIITDEQNEAIARCLNDMIYSVKGSTCNIHFVGEDPFENNSPTVAVPLTKCDIKTTRGIMTAFPNVEFFHSIRYFVPLEIVRYLGERYPNVSVLSTEIHAILCRSRLPQIMPGVIKWLKKSKNNSTIANSENDEAAMTNFLSSETFSMDSNDIEVKLSEDTLFRKDAVYIVIGGMTGLGWEITNLMAEKGAGYIISLSRRKTSKERQDECRQIFDNTGCCITSIQADVTSLSSLQDAFTEIKTKLPFPIKGIFQGAGVLDDSLFISMTPEKLRKVLLPKVLGTWNLHTVSKDISLDYFVMHSSMTSVFGNPGQSNYGAANAFMDSFAHYRRRTGLPAQSINWGPLKVGMVQTNENVEKALKQRGFDVLDIDTIRHCFLEILMNKSCQITYGSFDWTKIATGLTSPGMALVRYRFRGFLENVKDTGSTSSYIDQGLLVQKIKSLPPEEQIKNMIEIIQQIAGDVFAVDPSLLKPDTQITSLGIDSMLAMTFVNTVQETLNCKIPLVSLFSEDTTIRTLAETALMNTLDGTETHVAEAKKLDPSVFNAMTPYEKRAYDGHVRNPYDPSLYMFGDVEVPNFFAKQEYWIPLLHQVHYKYDALRTLFIPGHEECRYGVKRVTLKSSDIKIDFQIVPISNLLHNTRHPPNTDAYLFDSSKDLPMRTFFAKKGKRCIIRFVFNHLAMDLASIWMIMGDLKPNFGNKEEKDDKSSDDLDVAALVEKRMMKEEMSLRGFWKQIIPPTLQPMTLSCTGDLDTDPNHFNFTSLELSDSVVKKLKLCLERNSCSLFHFMTTFFQLCLHAELKQSIISIMTTMNLRTHFPEMANEVNRFTNRMPLFLTLNNQKELVASILQRNANMIVECFDRGHYPYMKILELIEDIPTSHVFRHQIVMEETSQASNIFAQDKRISLKVKKMQVGNYYNETIFYVWNDIAKNKIKLELGYSSLIIGPDQADDMLSFINMMIERFIQHPDITIDGMLSVDMTLNNAIYMTNGNIHEDRNGGIQIGNQNSVHQKLIGQFMKQTSGGWEHPVHLALESSTNDGVTEYFIRWGTDSNNLNKSLPFSSIDHLQMTEINGCDAIVVNVPSREFVFRTGNKRLAEYWRFTLRGKMK